MSETWLLSATPSVASTAVNAKVEFISNGESYDTLTVPTSEGTMGSPGYIQYYSSVRGQGNPAYFYFPAGWKNDAYRTVTFVSPLTDTNLKTWLASNGTKIGTNDYKRYYKNPILLGTGSYKYRPYTVLTPTVSLSLNLTGCSTTQTSMNRLGQTTITFTKQTGYNWPSTVQVTGATLVSWNAGTLVVEKATANTVTITVTCAKITYALTETLSNVTKTGTHPTTIEYGGTLTLKYTADANYELPDSVTVAGATSNWTKSTGTLVVSNPTGDVTITITAVRITYSITENLTNVTKVGTHPTVIAAGQTLVLNYAAATGYNLPDTVTVTGASQTWNKETGTLTLSNPTGNVTVSVVCVKSAINNVTIKALFPGASFGDVYYKLNDGDQIQIPCTKTNSIGNSWVETVMLPSVTKLEIMITGGDVSYYQIGEGSDTYMNSYAWYDISSQLYDNVVVTVYTDD